MMTHDFQEGSSFSVLWRFDNSRVRCFTSTWLSQLYCAPKVLVDFILYPHWLFFFFASRDNDVLFLFFQNCDVFVSKNETPTRLWYLVFVWLWLYVKPYVVFGTSATGSAALRGLCLLLINSRVSWTPNLRNSDTFCRSREKRKGRRNRWVSVHARETWRV